MRSSWKTWTSRNCAAHTKVWYWRPRATCRCSLNSFPSPTKDKEMGIWQKLSTLVRSNINDAIAKAENPEKMLNQVLLDMRDQLAKAKQEVAVAIADERKLKAQAEEEQKLAAD